MRCAPFALSALLLLAVSAAQAAGLRHFDVPAGPDGPAIRGVVWHPCAEPPHEIDARGGRTFFGVNDCPIVGDKLPLIVISHGRRGWLGGHHDTAAALADAGFIVVTINHPTDTERDTSGTDSLAVTVERPADIKRTIDNALRGWPDAARIDAGRIGLFGFSWGGYTGLAAIGGEPDLRRGLPSCQTSSLRACKELEGGERPSGPVIHDPRIKAAIIVDPFPVLFFAAENLKAVTIPIQLWSSDPAQNGDGLSGCCAAAINDRLPSRPEFHLVQDAKHFSFLATCTPEETAKMAAICTDAPGFDRLAFHQRFHAAAIAFFRTHLGEAGTR
ncbi:dienelactone hydrolase [Bradyrhizobium sp. 41S5]|uniref:alpha/beta hydrolase family protein n=1 Tax=Bradyrhizobium sp. 41S5 TaxID=1404443 RepID=UPI00156BA72B|nr:dienelactone hydrolase [Bradyrhizobium sp. 41S5]UFX47157.1 dienelactone hydrolase [Bradyrhizobium sp. 41S5]